MSYTNPLYYADAITVTPHDTNAVDDRIKAFMVDTDSPLTITTYNGTEVDLVVKVGAIYPIRPKIIHTTGYTGTEVIGLW